MPVESAVKVAKIDDWCQAGVEEAGERTGIKASEFSKNQGKLSGIWEFRRRKNVAANMIRRERRRIQERRLLPSLFGYGFL